MAGERGTGPEAVATIPSHNPQPVALASPHTTVRIHVFLPDQSRHRQPGRWMTFYCINHRADICQVSPIHAGQNCLFRKSLSMSSPFSFFRRNQHVTMVAIVILSMVAFTISDMMTQDVNHFVTLGVLLGGAVMAFLGISRGRWLQYGIAGAIAGGLLAWALPGFFGATGEFYQTSALGAFDAERIRELHLRKTIANSFLEKAFAKAFGAGTERFAPRFDPYYPTVEDDAIFGELLRAEAEEMGIVVTDQMVSSYINSNTGDKLAEKDFVDIRNELSIAGRRVSEAEIIEAFRSEIAALMAYMQKAPGLSAATQPPAALYDLFLRSQVRQRLNLVRLDVDAFVDSVPDPSDQEVQAAFSQHRERFPGQEAPGSMGFRQFNKASLAYLQLDFKSVEAAVPTPSDAEIEAFYNEKKDLFYRKPAEPPATPETPETDDSTPAPESPAPETPAPDAPRPEEPKPEEPKPEEPKPEEPSSDADPKGSPETEVPQSDAPKADPECGPIDEPTAVQTPAEPAAPGPASPTSETTSTGQEKPADTPAEPPTTPPATPPESVPPTSTEKPAEDPVPFVIPPVEYRPLDDELKSEIRDQLHEERIRREIDQRLNTVMSGLQTLERERSSKRRAIVKADQSIEPKVRAEKLREFNSTLLKGMEELGKTHGFAFAETGLLSARDLSTDDIRPIGTAQDATSGTPVFQMAFELFPGENDPYNDANLFTRKKAVKNQFAVEGQESHFVWWITEFSPSHIPELTDDIRKEVVLALKRQKARELAQKRGEALAKILNDEAAKPEAERKPAAELLQGQTVLDQAASDPVVVRQTQLFSWLEQDLTPQMNFMQRPRLRMSSINYADESGGEVRYAGDRFMRAVFEELPAGKASVVPDDELGVYYVAHATERIADQDVLRQMFLQEGRQFGFRQGGVADLLTATVLQPATTAWVDSMWKKYGIERSVAGE